MLLSENEFICLLYHFLFYHRNSKKAEHFVIFVFHTRNLSKIPVPLGVVIA